MSKEQQKPIPSIPIDWNKKIEDILVSPYFQEKIQNYTLQVENNSYLFPEFEFTLTEIHDIDILDFFLKKFDKFHDLLQEGIYNQVRIKIDNPKLIEREFAISEIHLIVNIEEYNFKNREILNFNQDLTSYVDKFCIFYGKFLNQQIERRMQILKIKYQCPVCGSTFEIINNFQCTKNIKPMSCVKGKCKNRIFTNADVLEKREIEHGYFMLGDEDIKHFNLNIEGRIFKNISYFDAKVENINFYEDVAIVGILRTDLSAIFDKRRKKEIEYYIEVIDLVSKREQKIDEGVIKTLKEKLNGIPNYREMLIDSFFPMTWMIDSFFSPKLAMALAYISGGSWNEKDNFRDTLNIIIGGGGSTYKSSLARNLRRFVRDNEILLHENRKITPAGLIGTTIRTPEGKIEIKHGALSMYSNGMIIIDEAQEMPFDLLTVFRCVETGDVFGIQDATTFHAPARSSLVFIQNFTKATDGYYNHLHTLFQNLSWKDSNAKSLLERFDLFCNIAKPDKFIKLWLNKNERKSSNEELIEEIYESLELDDYSFPKPIIELNDKLHYVLRNYLLMAKRTYRDSEVSEYYKENIRKLYITAINKELDVNNENELDLTQRSKNTCYKLLKGLTSLRLDSNVNELDYDYFRLKTMNLITAFRHSKLFPKINLEEVFIQSLVALIEKENPISIKDHIDYMRVYLKRKHFTYSLESEDLDLQKEIIEKLDSFIPEIYGLSQNYPYRKLLRLCEEKLQKRHSIFRKTDNKISQYHKILDLNRKKYQELLDFILRRINEMLEVNEGSPLDLHSICQIINIEKEKFSENEIKKCIEFLIHEGKINQDKIIK